MNYGYEGEVLLPVPLEIPGDATPGGERPLTAKVDFLVCADVCVPAGRHVALDLPVVAGAPPRRSAWGAPDRGRAGRGAQARGLHGGLPTRDGA